MILLSFTVRNHKSIRDEITIDFVKPSLRTLAPKGGTWADHTYPLVGIFGPNASGKSAVLDAILYAMAAIEYSSTAWQARSKFTREPFRLDERSRQASSVYEFQFVHEERRYNYGFEVDGKGVVSEWLREAPLRWRTLLERHRGEKPVRSQRTLLALGSVSDRELALSRALVLNDGVLAPIARDLIESFDIVSVKDVHRDSRLRSIAESLVDGSLSPLDIETLLQVADIGIQKVTVEEDDLPLHVRKALAQFKRALEVEPEGISDAADENDPPDGDSEGPAIDSAELDEEDSKQIVRNLLFTHRGESGDVKPFSVSRESDGTIAWLALMVPVIDTLRKGGLLLVDELDSSLHPHLLDVVLGLFVDRELNRHHAQLLFTSHETYVLSPLSDTQLAPEQVWFTDKSYDGVTELTCLADFARHADANVAKRYLAGRYGGTPRLAPSMLASLLVTVDA
ncbi:AAA family ATPase [Frondihabitans cladoniiphilus]|uniref:ATP/GTP-binding protein n=1 Tax=Frondihabitans cladoniiphilus TaxID=715785 RepID=A0ABP8WA46_9MICO